MIFEPKRKRQWGIKQFTGICTGVLLLLSAAEMLAICFWEADELPFQFLMAFVLICAVFFVVSVHGVCQNLE